MKVYRFIANDIGIYAAVDTDCPRDDKRRAAKPDGAWLPRVGKTYPGAISFWTEYGLERYILSGLQSWHSSVLLSPTEVCIANSPAQILYSDEYQVIAYPGDFLIDEILPLSSFLRSRFPGK